MATMQAGSLLADSSLSNYCFRILRRWCKDADLAQDLRQDVAVKLLLHDSCGRAVDQPCGLVRCTAWSVWCDHLRARRRKLAREQASTDGSALSAEGDSEPEAVDPSPDPCAVLIREAWVLDAQAVANGVAVNAVHRTTLRHWHLPARRAALLCGSTALAVRKRRSQFGKKLRTHPDARRLLRVAPGW